MMRKKNHSNKTSGAYLGFPCPSMTSCEKLCHYFEILTAPTFVVIGTDGKTLHADVSEAIEEHGVQAYPFTPEKFAELEEIENAK